jgi:cell filamentation protein
MNPEEREKLAGNLSSSRIFELYLDPIQGNYDVAHLKEIHRRIFQDFPAHGIDGYAPGEFRPPTAPDKLHKKNRPLEASPAQSYVGYSWMDKEAREKLAKVLADARPEKLSRLKTDDFVQAMSTLYRELDYIHPFREGNSRTLRTFTRQLAEAAGYDLDWTRFNEDAKTRDSLCIARDRAVNEILLPRLPESEVKFAVMDSIQQFSNRAGLQNLLKEAIRPSRAIAFEQKPEAAALKAFPELSSAYKTLRQAKQYFEAKMPGKQSGQKTALQMVKENIQARLDAGEIQDFKPTTKQAVKKEHRAVKTKAKDEPEMER